MTTVFSEAEVCAARIRDGKIKFLEMSARSYLHRPLAETSSVSIDKNS